MFIVLGMYNFDQFEIHTPKFNDAYIYFAVDISNFILIWEFFYLSKYVPFFLLKLKVFDLSKILCNEFKIGKCLQFSYAGEFER